MSTYIPNTQDYIPQLQPYDPGLNFYAGVLQEKQGQYNAGLSKINSLYGSILNSPLLRTDNIERRSKYFKTIETDLQKVAKLDLSIDNNVNTASKLFDPIINDKHIIKDMAYTRQLQKAYQTSEQYRNSVDPEKSGGAFWQTGVDALNYAADEFKNATPDESLYHQAPSYTPYQNVTKKAIKAAKDAGFNVTYDSVQGGYIVTDTNGQMLLGKNNDGLLPQFLYGVFGNDSSIQKMYATQAYVGRKSFAKQNASQYGSENAAEMAYLNNVISKTVPKLEKSKNDLSKMKSELAINKTSLEYVVQDKGGILPGDGTQDTYGQLMQLVEGTAASEKYHENVANLISSAPNLNDVKAMRNRADNIVANSLFQREIEGAALDYAMGTSKHELKADPYALAAYNNSLDLSKAIHLKNMDNQIWKEQQSLLGNIGNAGNKGAYYEQVLGQMQAKGLGIEDLAKLGVTPLNFKTPAAQAKLAAAGILSGEDVKVSQPFLSSGGNSFKNQYFENSDITGKAVDEAVGISYHYLGDTFNSMKSEYNRALNNPDKAKGKAIREQILTDAKNILKGTNLNPEDVVTGRQTINNLSTKDIGSASSFAKDIQQNSHFSKLYNSGWSEDKVVQLELANQTAAQLLEKSTQYNKEAKDKVLSGYQTQFVNGDITEKDYIKKVALFHSSYDDNGQLRSPAQARNAYVKGATKFYNEPSPQLRKLDTGLEFANNKSDELKAGEDFSNNYWKVQTEFNKNIKALDSRVGSNDEGGSEAVGNSNIYGVSASKPLSRNFIDFKNIAQDLKDHLGDIRFTAAPEPGKKLEADNINQLNHYLGNLLLDKIYSGDTKGLDFTYQIQPIPKEYRGEMFENSNIPSLWENDFTQKSKALLGLGELPGDLNKEGVGIKVILSDDTARDWLGKKKSEPISEQEKSFMVAVPSGLGSLGKIAKRSEKSSADIYMAQDGASLNFNLGVQKGGFSLKNNKGNYSVIPVVYMTDEESGEMKAITLHPQPLPNVKIEDAVKAGSSIVNEYYAADQVIRQNFLKRQKNARSK